jgi:predicted DsbA family dithiol-disulfide isomerase
VEVEIWSDIVCPWCYIGKRRFESALAGFEHSGDVHVTWRSFELDPSEPRMREVDGATHLAQKYGTTREHALAMQAQMTANAATEGLDFRFDIARAGNTFDAHRILKLAAAHGSQDRVEERLMSAYLTDGEPIGDPDALQRLAVDAGLPADEVVELLASDRYGEDVRSDESTAAALGITAVPFFVVDRALGSAGAQPPETLLALLQRGWEARSPLSVVSGGPSCGPDGC